MFTQTILHASKGEQAMGLRQDGNRKIQVVRRRSGISARIRWLTCAALTGLAVLATSASAQAGVLVSSATNCDTQVLEQPFLRFADPASYVLAPSGTFERDMDAWTLTGGASVVSGNEPFFVHAPGEASSLSLPPNSSATSAPMCVGIEHPTLRLLARNRGGLLSTLQVEVLFEDAAGNTQALPIGALLGGSAWKPTLPMPVVVNLLPLLPGEHTAVAFRFSTGNANWQIDDVYVDPYRSR
jgi:hypothetical protein